MALDNGTSAIVCSVVRSVLHRLEDPLQLLRPAESRWSGGSAETAVAERSQSSDSLSFPTVSVV